MCLNFSSFAPKVTNKSDLLKMRAGFLGRDGLMWLCGEELAEVCLMLLNCLMKLGPVINAITEIWEGSIWVGSREQMASTSIKNDRDSLLTHYLAAFSTVILMALMVVEVVSLSSFGLPHRATSAFGCQTRKIWDIFLWERGLRNWPALERQGEAVDCPVPYLSTG